MSKRKRLVIVLGSALVAMLIIALIKVSLGVIAHPADLLGGYFFACLGALIGDRVNEGDWIWN